MIPKTIREGATPQNLPGETARFTIAANGKAFRTLIDGLYSNKVRAVIRELCSNAADSHIDAGNVGPFDVTIPTALHPVFCVRDYGTGLSHDQVMHLYTTIFQSTKETTNDQTGQLGLGSKSPFAYTDSFQVTTWDGTTKRSYIAFLATDGVPSITHVGDEDSTDARGLEVSFAAHRDDIRRFQSEMQFVSMGYDVKPNVSGMALAVPTPRLTGPGWAIYANGAFGEDVRGRHFVRQGSAVYPNDQYPFPYLGGGWISVVDIPIGTADVTASRESISYDNQTIVAVRQILAVASNDLKAQVDAEIDAAATRIEKAKVYQTYNGIFSNIKGSVEVSLLPDGWDSNGKDKDNDDYVLEKASFFGKAWPRYSYQHRDRLMTSFEVQYLDKLVILVNDEETKVVRRKARIKAAADQYGHFTYVLDVDAKKRNKMIKWIKECFEIADNRFIVVSTLPDCPPPRNPNPAKKARRELPAGAYWLVRAEGITETRFGNSWKRTEYWLPNNLRNYAELANFTLPKYEDVFFVNNKQHDAMKKRGELPENRRLDNAVYAAMEKTFKKMPIEDAVASMVIESEVDERAAGQSVLMERFFSDIKKPQNAADIQAFARILGVDLHSLPIHAKITEQIKELRERFPLCFRYSDKSHYEQYIDAIEASA